MITTIYDHLEIDYGEVKHFLQVNDLYDGTGESPKEQEIMEMVDAAKRKADHLIQQEPIYFEDEEGNVNIPEDIKVWVLKYTAHLFERRVTGEAERSINGAESYSWKEDRFDTDELVPYMADPVGLGY